MDAQMLNLPTSFNELDEITPKSVSSRLQQVKTPKDAVAIRSAHLEPSLQELTFIHGQGSVKQYLVAHLATLNKFLKADDKLSVEEMEFVVDEVYDEYRQIFTFADINIIFNRAKRGDYGKLYNKVSASDILEWFRTYQLEWDEEQVKKNQRKQAHDRQAMIANYQLPYHLENGQLVIDKQQANFASPLAEAKRKVAKDGEYQIVKAGYINNKF